MTETSTTDRGATLPMVLVMTIVLSALVAAIATYTATALRSTTVTTARVDRLADAEGVLRRSLATLVSTGSCTPGTFVGPNGASVQTACGSHLVDASTSVKNFALVLTGLGLADEIEFRRFDTLDRNQEMAVVDITGEVFVGAGVTGQAQKVLVSDGIRVERSDCTGYVPTPLTWLTQPSGQTVKCTDTQSWWDVSAPPTGISVPTSSGTTKKHGSCEVFSPGVWSSITIGSNTNNYFRSGVYLIDGGTVTLRGYVNGGSPPGGSSISATSPNSVCRDAQLADIAESGPGGVVFILKGPAWIDLSDKLNSLVLEGYVAGSRMVSIIAAPPSTTEYPHNLPLNTRTPRTISRESQPILNSPPTANFQFNGEVWTPRGFLDLGNLSSWQAGRGFLGGLTASRFEFKQTGGAAGGLTIISNSEFVPEQLRHRLTATATDEQGGSTTVSAVARRSAIEFVLESWRVH